MVENDDVFQKFCKAYNLSKDDARTISAFLSLPAGNRAALASLLLDLSARLDPEKTELSALEKFMDADGDLWISHNVNYRLEWAKVVKDVMPDFYGEDPDTRDRVIDEARQLIEEEHGHGIIKSFTTAKFKIEKRKGNKK